LLEISFDNFESSFAYFDRRRVIVHAEKDKEIPSGMNKQQGDKDKAMCRE
jgi:hypothetical protein